MSLHIHIPEGGAFFSLFARGRIVKKTTVSGEGTFIQCEGAAALFYTYPHCRRAYVVRRADETRCHRALRLPNVEERVAVLFRAGGRRVDLLRNALYFLAQSGGEGVFLYDAVFWQRVACLIEGCAGRRSRSLRTNIELLVKRRLVEMRRRRVKHGENAAAPALS
jgi:hypothetical protein